MTQQKAHHSRFVKPRFHCSSSKRGKSSNSKSSYNLTDSDSLKLVMADTASVESNVKKVMNQNQDDDNLSSANIVMIMDLEDSQSDHEL